MTAKPPTELLTQELSCAICLQLYQNPVSLPCGHSYCLNCVHSSQTSCQPGVLPCCPECRQQYDGTEPLLRNFKLSGIVEGFRMAVSGGALNKTPGPVVSCDQCLDTTVPAVKTCLHCDTSLCQPHLTKHQERHRSRTHVVTEPVQEHSVSICPEHQQRVEYLCSQDRLLLCSDCVMEGKHQEHDVQALEAAKSDLRRVVESLGKSASDRLQMTQALLRNTRNRGPERASEVLVARASILLDNMSTRITTYKERMKSLAEDEMKQLEKMWQSSTDALSEYQQQLSKAQAAAEGLLASSSSDVLFIHYYLALEPQLRQAASVTVPTLPVAQQDNTKYLRASLATDEFRSEISDLLRCLLSLTNPLELSFNPATLHPSLMLSTDLQTVRHGAGAKAGPGEHGERFTTAVQVLCQQSFTRGAHVWAVELGPGCAWSAGICYGTIPRKGEHSKLGHSALSWRLQWKNKKLTACHDSVTTTLEEVHPLPLKRLEVVLDYNGGTLSFYSTDMKGKKQHLYMFRATFREAVYPAFGLHSTTDESWITLLNVV